MNRWILLSVLLVLAAADAALAKDACLDCHEKKTPGIVSVWRESAHARKNISCTDCHGTDADACHNRTVLADAGRCGKCHKRELADHRGSKHGIAGRAGRACTRTQPMTPEQQKSCSGCHDPSDATFVNTEGSMFLAQSPNMQRQGCSACHAVESRCDTCHTRHATDLAPARDPATCGTCHMGPDHPQMEMWETSRHGVLFTLKGADTAPSCVTCHMQAGSHNVSRGISTQSNRNGEREFMLAACSRCHTRKMSERQLADADAIRTQSMSLVNEARQIVAGLEQEGLLAPSPVDRPGHPLFGKTFVLGPQMLYENLSLPESLFFKMIMFQAPTAWKGAYHQNPDYSHWFGNAPLKLSLSELASQAALLRSVDRLKKRIDAADGKNRATDNAELEDIKGMLRLLDEQRLRQEISEQEYRQKKKKILDEHGL